MVKSEPWKASELLVLKSKNKLFSKISQSPRESEIPSFNKSESELPSQNIF